MPPWPIASGPEASMTFKAKKRSLASATDRRRSDVLAGLRIGEEGLQGRQQEGQG